jgi:hypothetical protein
MKLKLENILNINYISSAFQKDYITYYLFKKKIVFIELFVLFSLAILFWFMISLSIIEDNWSFLPIVLIFTGIFLLVFDIYKCLKAKKDIIKKSLQLPKKTENVIFYENRIEFTFLKQTECIFFSQLKKVKEINGTLFLISENKNDWPFRLNPDEIQGLNISDIKQLLDIKIKKHH